jgi:hypothetical protein
MTSIAYIVNVHIWVVVIDFTAAFDSFVIEIVHTVYIGVRRSKDLISSVARNGSCTQKNCRAKNFGEVLRDYAGLNVKLVPTTKLGDGLALGVKLTVGPLTLVTVKPGPTVGMVKVIPATMPLLLATLKLVRGVKYPEIKASVVVTPPAGGIRLRTASGLVMPTVASVLKPKNSSEGILLLVARLSISFSCAPDGTCPNESGISQYIQPMV